MKKKIRFGVIGYVGVVVALLGFSGLILGCLPFLDWRQPAVLDYKPPVLVGWEVRSAVEVWLDFNEEVVALGSGAGVELVTQGKRIAMKFNPEMKPGEEVRQAIALQDLNENRVELVLTFYGYNPRVPQMVINEIRVAGSSSRPDLVEFYVKEEGSLAGVTFYRGSIADSDFFYVFPPVEVKAGDYVLLHPVPEGIDAEVDELKDKGESGGKEASPDAWDFWLKEREGLSGTNGVLTLTRSPGGEVLDCVVYSNRTSLSDTNYDGFGSTTNLTRANWAFEVGAWIGAGELIAPEDCINPTKSTSTRTICRNSNNTDTNSKEDWHIVPTGECSFGWVNCDEKYEP